jgi:hypothetical protein
MTSSLKIELVATRGGDADSVDEGFDPATQSYQKICYTPKAVVRPKTPIDPAEQLVEVLPLLKIVRFLPNFAHSSAPSEFPPGFLQKNLLKTLEIDW